MKIYAHMNNKAGFTLIEVIASLVIFGMMFTMAGMGIVMSARGYVFTKENAHMAQKAQLAMSRMTRELMEMTDVVAKDDAQPYIIYDVLDGRNALALDGANLRLFSNIGAQTTLPVMSVGDILVDEVGGLTISTYKGSAAWVQGADPITDLTHIQIDLVLTRTDSELGSKTFTTVVRPRNTRNQ